jgi:hypothetical protein
MKSSKKFNENECIEKKLIKERCFINMTSVKEVIMQPTNITFFSGTSSEDVSDWLRQFRNFEELYGLSQEKLHLYASTFLRGEAGKYYDSIENPQKNFDEFRRLLLERYGIPEPDRTGRLKNFLNRIMNNNEGLRDYCKSMYLEGKKANIYDEIIIQTIIKNMNSS